VHQALTPLEIKDTVMNAQSIMSALTETSWLNLLMDISVLLAQVYQLNAELDGNADIKVFLLLM